MSETAAPAVGTPAPAAPPPVAPPAAQQVAPSPPNVGEPDWLNGRIAQAKKSAEADTLKALGVSNLDEAKAAVDAAKAAAEATKTAQQKAVELDAQLKVERAKSSGYEQTIKARASVEIEALTTEQKTAVTAIAGDDPAKQLSTIDALRPTWAKPAAAEGAKGAKPLPAPASTTAAPNAPPANDAPPAPVDVAAQYDELKAKNPMLASYFYEEHSAEIAAARKAKAAAK